MKKTFEYNGRTCCKFCKLPLNGTAAYHAERVTTNGKQAYLHASCVDDYAANRAAAAYAVAGEMNKVGCAYRFTFTVKHETDALLLAFLGNNTAWYHTAEREFTSPLLLSLKCHKLFATIGKLCKAANVHVEVYDYSGNILQVEDIDWNEHGNHGRWLPKEERKEGKLLRKLDEVTEERKGYSNYAK